MSGDYDDIIDLPRHVSTKHPHMSANDRAAQFSPFAALTGYDDAIQETLRQTEAKIEPDEEQRALLNSGLQFLSDCAETNPVATFIFFVPDAKKAGGAYQTLTGRVKRVDATEGVVVLTDGQSLPFADILAIDCALIPKTLE